MTQEGTQTIYLLTHGTTDPALESREPRTWSGKAFLSTEDKITAATRNRCSQRSSVSLSRVGLDHIYVVSKTQVNCMGVSTEGTLVQESTGTPGLTRVRECIFVTRRDLLSSVPCILPL